jgi:hypothetical protein
MARQRFLFACAAAATSHEMHALIGVAIYFGGGRRSAANALASFDEPAFTQPNVSLYGAIATLRKRLARAQAERDGCRAAGDEQQYRKACALVQTLAEELEKREFAARGRAMG